MRVIVLQASPLMDKGNTSRILTPFLDGLKDEGADVGSSAPRSSISAAARAISGAG